MRPNFLKLGVAAQIGQKILSFMGLIPPAAVGFISICSRDYDIHINFSVREGNQYIILNFYSAL